MTTERLEEPAAPVDSPMDSRLRRILTVRNFAVFSVIHSVLFTGLMLCAFVLGKPQPVTFFFGFTHGVLYMVMTAACIVAARLRIVSVTMALIVVIVGLFGPYFGAFEFIRELREQRRRLDEPLLSDGG
jgi:hypothetical protein